MTQDISRTGGAGDDTLTGGLGDDILTGGLGDDTLTGSDGDDTLTGGTASAGADADFLAMNPGSSDDDTLDGGAGDDTLDGGAGDDTLDGGTGDDTLYGGDGDDAVDGGAGNDVLFGGRGADRLTGGRGADSLYGGNGHDIFAFSVGDGADYINDFEAGDIIEIAGVPGGFEDLVVEQKGSHTVIRYGDGDTITLSGVSADSLDANDFRFLPVEATPPQNGGEDTASQDDLAQGVPLDGNDEALIGGSAGGRVLEGGYGANTLTGGDGDDTLWGRKGNDTLAGGKGADTLGGGKGKDILIGGSGDDTLTGGRGTDTFVFAAGDGTDTITDFGTGDRIRLDGVSGGFAGLIIEQNGADTVIRYGEGADTITLSSVSADSLGDDDFILPAAAGDSETVVYGTSTKDEDNDGGNPLDNDNDNDNDNDGGDPLDNDNDGGDPNADNDGGEDTIPGASGDNPLDVEVCGETIHGGWGADSLFGTACDDTIYGNSGDDKLYGRKGDDIIHGGGGNDLLRGNSGDDELRGGDGNDTLRGRDGDDLLEGGKGWDWLSGGLGNDALRGGAGNDYFVFGTEGYAGKWGFKDGGDDTILDFEDGTDYIVLGSVDGEYRFDDLDIRQSGSDAVITWSLGTITLKGIQASQLSKADVLAHVPVELHEPHLKLDDSMGDDALQGRAGLSDRFGFTHGGDDTILDFDHGRLVKDRIAFYSVDSELGFDDLDIRQSGSDAVITWWLGTVTLEGIQASQLTAADFDFIG